MPSELFINLPWGRLAARQWGDAAGLPVLALHGWLDNANSFERLAEKLDPRLRIVAVDLPGHGLSDRRPGTGPYHFLDYAIDMVDAVDALGWQDFVILGHSMGGGVGAVVAGTCPERVTGLVLLDSMGPLPEMETTPPQRLRSYLDARKKILGRKISTYASVDEAVSMRLRAGGLGREAAEALARRGVTREDGRVHWHFDRRLQLPGPLRLGDDQAVAFLQAVQCPTYALRAKSGYPVPEAMWRARLAHLAKATYAEVPGEHHVHLDDPGVVADSVRPFFEAALTEWKQKARAGPTR